jgi:hypothetical protein
VRRVREDIERRVRELLVELGVLAGAETDDEHDASPGESGAN